MFVLRISVLTLIIHKFIRSLRNQLSELQKNTTSNQALLEKKPLWELTNRPEIQITIDQFDTIPELFG